MTEYDRIVDKVERIKTIQRQRVASGNTIHKVGDAFVLNVDEAEYLIDIIEKVRGFIRDQSKRS